MLTKQRLDDIKARFNAACNMLNDSQAAVESLGDIPALLAHIEGVEAERREIADHLNASIELCNIREEQLGELLDEPVRKENARLREALRFFVAIDWDMNEAAAGGTPCVDWHEGLEKAEAFFDGPFKALESEGK